MSGIRASLSIQTSFISLPANDVRNIALITKTVIKAKEADAMKEARAFSDKKLREIKPTLLGRLIPGAHRHAVEQVAKRVEREVFSRTGRLSSLPTNTCDLLIKAADLVLALNIGPHLKVVNVTLLDLEVLMIGEP